MFSFSKIKSLGIFIVLFLVTLLWNIQSASAGIVEDFSNALKNGKPTLELRLAYEYVNINELSYPNKHPGNEISLRTRVGYRTGEFLKTTAYIQLQNVTNLMEQFSFKRGYPGKIEGDTAQDFIGDPHGSRVQQAYLDFRFIPQTLIRLGRQEITLDDQRLIGNVDWRQNGQSFDALTIINHSVPNLTLFTSYINQVNTIFLGHMDLDAFYLFHATYTGIKEQSISAFVYLLDTEDESSSARDCGTYGIRAAGNVPILKEIALKYAVDYAYQGDFQDGKDHNANMFNAFLGAKINVFNVGAGFSYISGQDGNDKPFDTLFSTAHKFNGWADEFLATNGGKLTAGLKDYYIQAGVKVIGTKFLAVYHYFDTTDEKNQFDGTYGDEIDLLAARKLTKNLSTLLKFAYYNRKDNDSSGYLNPTTDKTVFWARLIYKF